MQKTTDGKIKLGGDLTPDQMKKMQSAGLSGSQILDSIDDLNSEIYETAQKFGVELPKNSPPKVLGKKVKKETVMSLDDELDQLNAKLDRKLQAQQAQQEAITEEVKEEVAEETAGTGDSIKDQVMDLLQKAHGAPSQAQINAWKAQHGQNGVYAIGMGEGDVYVFTHLKRGQWKKIQEVMSKMSQADESFDTEDEMKKKVVQYCVLWPNPLPLEFFYNSRAGVLDAIYQSILLNSYFLSPQQTMMLTTQL